MPMDRSKFFGQYVLCSKVPAQHENGRKKSENISGEKAMFTKLAHPVYIYSFSISAYN
jgi:hypothetical protein